MKWALEIFNNFIRTVDFSNIVDIFKNPEFHAKEIPLLLSILSIFTLAVIIYYYITIYRKHKKETPKEEKLRKNAMLLGFSVGLAIVFLYVPTLYFMSARSCLQCHQKTGNHFPLLEQAHSNVDCRECHIKPGLTGSLDGMFKLTSKIMKINLGRNYDLSLSCCISSQSCLNCHRYVLHETATVRYTKVSHREIFSMFRDCTSCHCFKTERQTLKPLEIMEKCSKCHDGISAKNNCNVCHTLIGKPSKNLPDLSNFPKTTISGEVPIYEGQEPSPSVNVKDF